MAKIDDPNEVQFRQINPNWMEWDGPSRLAFIPTKKDDGKLSLDSAANATEKQSFDNFRALGLKSEAVFGVTVGEFLDAPNQVQCFESPLTHNPHHSHAEFSGLTNGEMKAKSQQLRRFAMKRGKLHP